MALLKKWFVFILYYAIASLIGIISVSFLSLTFKLLLITVQGPTMFSTIAEILTFYFFFSIASLFLFRNYRKKYQRVKIKEIVVFYISILLLHLIIIFYGGWNSIYTITNGSLPITIRLYSGTFERTHGILYSSLRDIPRIYYYIGQSIEDVYFIVLSFIGFLLGTKSSATKDDF